MLEIRIGISAVVVLILSIGTGLAQPKANSPFSRLGIGDIVERDYVPVYSLGGIGAAYHHPYITNLVNPASLAMLEATSFEVAVSGRYANMSKDDFSQEVWSGNLEYLSLSIPLVNPINNLIERRESNYSGGLNISIAPYSNVGYFVLALGDIDNVGNVTSNFNGNGGTSRFNVGTGWRYGRFSAGANLGYLFGNIQYESETRFEDLFNRYDHVERTEFSLRGFVYDLGLMYVHPLQNSKKGNPRSLTIGTHFNTATSFSGSEDYLNYVTNLIFSDADTAAFEVDGGLEGTLPGQFGIGILFTEGSRFKGGVTYTTSTWDKYENSSQPSANLKNTWRVGLGGSYTPDLNSITSYLSRVEYRAGVYYQTDPRSLGGEQMKQYGVTVGFSLPFIQQRLFSFVDVAIEYGWRGVEDSLKENYLRFKVGLNLNDTQWFLKRRFN